MSDEYQKRIADLQKYLPFLENTIKRLKSEEGKLRESQISKLQSLLDFLKNTEEKKLKLDVLRKCEEVILKLYEKRPSSEIMYKYMCRDPPDDKQIVDNRLNLGLNSDDTFSVDQQKPSSKSTPENFLLTRPVVVPSEKFKNDRHFSFVDYNEFNDPASSNNKNCSVNKTLNSSCYPNLPGYSIKNPLYSSQNSNWKIRTNEINPRQEPNHCKFNICSNKELKLTKDAFEVNFSSLKLEDPKPVPPPKLVDFSLKLEDPKPVPPPKLVDFSQKLEAPKPVPPPKLADFSLKYDNPKPVLPPKIKVKRNRIDRAYLEKRKKIQLFKSSTRCKLNKPPLSKSDLQELFSSTMSDNSVPLVDENLDKHVELSAKICTNLEDQHKVSEPLPVVTPKPKQTSKVVERVIKEQDNLFGMLLSTIDEQIMSKKDQKKNEKKEVKTSKDANKDNTSDKNRKDIEIKRKKDETFVNENDIYKEKKNIKTNRDLKYRSEHSKHNTKHKEYDNSSKNKEHETKIIDNRLKNKDFDSKSKNMEVKSNNKELVTKGKELKHKEKSKERKSEEYDSQIEEIFLRLKESKNKGIKKIDKSRQSSTKEEKQKTDKTINKTTVLPAQPLKIDYKKSEQIPKFNSQNDLFWPNRDQCIPNQIPFTRKKDEIVIDSDQFYSNKEHFTPNQNHYQHKDNFRLNPDHFRRYSDEFKEKFVNQDVPFRSKSVGPQNLPQVLNPVDLYDNKDKNEREDLYCQKSFKDRGSHYSSKYPITSHGNRREYPKGASRSKSVGPQSLPQELNPIDFYENEDKNEREDLYCQKSFKDRGSHYSHKYPITSPGNRKEYPKGDSRSKSVGPQSLHQELNPIDFYENDKNEREDLYCQKSFKDRGRHYSNIYPITSHGNRRDVPYRSKSVGPQNLPEELIPIDFDEDEDKNKRDDLYCQKSFKNRGSHYSNKYPITSHGNRREYAKEERRHSLDWFSNKDKYRDRRRSSREDRFYTEDQRFPIKKKNYLRRSRFEEKRIPQNENCGNHRKRRYTEKKDEKPNIVPKEEIYSPLDTIVAKPVLVKEYSIHNFRIPKICKSEIEEEKIDEFGESKYEENKVEVIVEESKNGQEESKQEVVEEKEVMAKPSTSKEITEFSKTEEEEKMNMFNIFMKTIFGSGDSSFLLEYLDKKCGKPVPQSKTKKVRRIIDSDSESEKEISREIGNEPVEKIKIEKTSLPKETEQLVSNKLQEEEKVVVNETIRNKSRKQRIYSSDLSPEKPLVTNEESPVKEKIITKKSVRKNWKKRKGLQLLLDDCRTVSKGSFAETGDQNQEKDCIISEHETDNKHEETLEKEEKKEGINEVTPEKNKFSRRKHKSTSCFIKSSNEENSTEEKENKEEMISVINEIKLEKSKIPQRRSRSLSRRYVETIDFSTVKSSNEDNCAEEKENKEETIAVINEITPEKSKFPRRRLRSLSRCFSEKINISSDTFLNEANSTDDKGKEKKAETLLIESKISAEVKPEKKKRGRKPQKIIAESSISSAIESETSKTETIKYETGEWFKNLQKKKRRRTNWANGIIKQNRKKNKLYRGKLSLSLSTEIRNLSESGNFNENIEIKSELPQILQSQILNDDEYGLFKIDSKQDIHYFLDRGSSFDCKLCDYKGKFIVSHYRTRHPESENLISRLNPEEAEKAKMESKMNKFDEIEPFEEIVNGKKRKTTFVCRFCKMIMTTEILTFVDHLCCHTGEYRYSCELCPFITGYKQSISIHYFNTHPEIETLTYCHVWPSPPNFRIMFGYLCKACNFTQILRKNIQTHINVSHLGQNIEIIKISMSSESVSLDDVITTKNIETKMDEIEQNKEKIPEPIKENGPDNNFSRESHQIEDMHSEEIKNVKEELVPKKDCSIINLAETESNSEENENTSPKSVEDETMELSNETEKMKRNYKEMNISNVEHAISTDTNQKAVLDKIQELTANLSENKDCYSEIAHLEQIKIEYQKEKFEYTEKNINVGAIEVQIRNEKYSYICKVPNCNFTNLHKINFIQHCNDVHSKITVLCEICEKENPHNYFTMISLFSHLFDVHNINSTNPIIVNSIPAQTSEIDPLQAIENMVLNLESSPPDMGFLQIKDIRTLTEEEEQNLQLNSQNTSSKLVQNSQLIQPNLENVEKNLTDLPANNESKCISSDYKKQLIAENFTSYITQKIFNEMLVYPKILDIYKCPIEICSFSSGSQKHFKIHMTSHKCKVTVCVYCQKGFNPENLAKHIKSFHSHYTLQCAFCFYRTISKIYLVYHLKNVHKESSNTLAEGLFYHLNPKNTTKFIAYIPPRNVILFPYKCNQDKCVQQFLIADDFMAHLRTYHKNNLICAICDDPTEYYATAQILIQHYVMHNIARYQCQYCICGTNDIDTMFMHYAKNHQHLEPICYVRQKKNGNVSPKTLDDIMLINMEQFEEPKLNTEQSTSKQNISISSPTITSTIPEDQNYSFSFVEKSPTTNVARGEKNLENSKIINTDLEKAVENSKIINTDLDNYTENSEIIRVAENSNFNEPHVTLKHRKIESENAIENAVDPRSNDNFEKSDELTKNLADLIKNGFYKCGAPSCTYSTDFLRDFKMHLFTCNTLTNTYFCGHCDTKFTSVANFRNHIEILGENRFTCEICEYKSSLEQVVKHMKDLHKILTTKLNPVSLKKGTDKDHFIVEAMNEKEMDKENHKYIIKSMPLEDATLSKEKNKVFGPEVIDYGLTHTLNPDPGLKKNEKMADEKIDLATISQNERIGGETKEKTDKENKADDIHPEFIPVSKRFICGALNCNYLTHGDQMLRHHLAELHAKETAYKCPHCQIDIPSKIHGLEIDKILCHLKMHDSHLYKCPNCEFFHYNKRKIEKHIYENHPETDNNIVIIRELDNSTNLNEDKPTLPVSLLEPIDTNEESQHGVISQLKCSKSKFKCSVKTNIIEHLKKSHLQIHGEPDIEINKIDEEQKVAASSSKDNTKEITSPLQQQTSEISHLRVNHENEESNVSESHISSEDMSNSPSNFNCKYCDFVAKTTNALWEHERSHSMNYTSNCNCCNYASQIKSQNKTKMKTKISELSLKRKRNCALQITSQNKTKMKTKISKSELSLKRKRRLIEENLEENPAKIFPENKQEITTDKGTTLTSTTTETIDNNNIQIYYACSLCSKRSYELNEIRSHFLKKHADPFKYKKVIMDKSKIGHYKCNSCGWYGDAKSVEPYCLKIHYKNWVILRKTKLKCTICSQKFVILKSVKDHFKKYHSTENLSFHTILEAGVVLDKTEYFEEKQMIFICIYCNDQFDNRTELFNHHSLLHSHLPFIETPDAKKQELRQIKCPNPDEKLQELRQIKCPNPDEKEQVLRQIKCPNPNEKEELQKIKCPNPDENVEELKRIKCPNPDENEQELKQIKCPNPDENVEELKQIKCPNPDENEQELKQIKCPNPDENVEELKQIKCPNPDENEQKLQQIKCPNPDENVKELIQIKCPNPDEKGQELKKFKCPNCGHSSNKYRPMRQHLIDHFNVQLPFQCSHCNSCFTYQHTLKYHHVRRHGDLPLIINKTPKSSKSIEKIIATMLHLNEDGTYSTKIGKPYLCSHCNASFAYQMRLKYHYILKHRDLPVPKFTKQINENGTYSRKNKLKRPNRIDLDEPPTKILVLDGELDNDPSFKENDITSNQPKEFSFYGTKPCDITDYRNVMSEIDIMGKVMPINVVAMSHILNLTPKVQVVDIKKQKSF